MTVYLVGAGPGDPGLLTVRGRALLERAEVLVYDRLVSQELLRLAPASARLVDVGKSPERATVTQDEINALLVEHGRAGRLVVRLKGGDPFVLGRGGEEAQVLAAAGVPFEVVPGVTSAFAVPAYAGIPVTHRGLAGHVTVVTGHEDPAKVGTEVDWEALGRTRGTLVVLMGVGNLGEITGRLLAAGRAPDTPAAAVRWGTLPAQRTVRATLATLASEHVEAPAVVVVGDVAGLDLAWFERRPLFGRRVVVTRAREQAGSLRARLEELGAGVVEIPAIEVEPLDFALPELGRYAWVVFTSANGVAGFFDRGLGPAGLDARALAGCRVAAIGPGTAESLARRGLRVDLVPERFVAEALLDVFPPPGDGARVLLPRAEGARDVLPAGLRDRGYVVDVLPVYRTVAARLDPAEAEGVRRGGVDAITFTSASTVERFLHAVGTLPEPQPLVACIGPVTAEAAQRRGLRVDVVAEEHTIDGLVGVLVEAISG